MILNILILVSVLIVFLLEAMVLSELHYQIEKLKTKTKNQSVFTVLGLADIHEWSEIRKFIRRFGEHREYLSKLMAEAPKWQVVPCEVCGSMLLKGKTICKKVIAQKEITSVTAVLAGLKGIVGEDYVKKTYYCRACAPKELLEQNDKKEPGEDK